MASYPANYPRDIQSLGYLSAFTTQWRDIEAKVQRLNPRWFPFNKILSAMGNEPARSSTFQNVIIDPRKEYVTLGAELAAAGVTATVANVHGINVGDLLFTALSDGTADEWLYVTDIASSTTLTVVRAFGSSNDGVIASGVKLYLVGKSHPEGEAPGVETYRYDYLWNHVHAIATQMTSSLRKILEQDRVSDEELQRAEAIVHHEIDQELVFLFSVRNNVAGETEEAAKGEHFATGGLRWWINTANAGAYSVQHAKSGFNLDKWRDFIIRVGQYGMGEKYMVVGLPLYKEIRQLYDDTWVRTGPDTLDFPSFDLDTIIGMPIHLIPHPALKNDWAYYGVAFDPQYLRAKTLMPTSISKVDYGAATRRGYEMVTMKGLKCINPYTLCSLELTL